MARCDTCDNDYDKCFQVLKAGREYTFDSLECAIEAIAPRCTHCGCRIIGHGAEREGTMYCCAHCANQGIGTKMRDRA